MNWIVQLYTNHPYASTLGTYWVLSAFIGALPAPTAGSSKLYVFTFQFCNTLFGNIIRALSSKVESSPNFTAAVSKLNTGA